MFVPLRQPLRGLIAPILDSAGRAADARDRAAPLLFPRTTVGGTVPATLSLTLGTPASFGAFTPGVAQDYTASHDRHGDLDRRRRDADGERPEPDHPGHLVNGSVLAAAAAQVARASRAAVDAIEDLRGAGLQRRR